jgi:hypothetical protein
MSLFNGSYALKLVIVVDESRIEKKDMDKVRAMSTAQTIQLRRMYQDHQAIDFFGKFVLLSNIEREFAYLNDHDIRFWIRKLKPVNFDPDFEEKLKSEIPAFLHFLFSQKLSTTKQSRMWFTPEQLATDELRNVKIESRSWLCKEVIEALINYMNDNGLNECKYTARDIKVAFFSTNNQIGVSDINRALREEMNMRAKKTTTRYKFPKDINAKPGKPYLFYLKDLE